MVRLAIVGPGIHPIPPIGWGAVESLIWDYKMILERDYNFVVAIINTKDLQEIARQVNDFQPDVVHIHYDDYLAAAKQFTCQRIILSSHYSYLDRLTKERDGFLPMHQTYLDASHRGYWIICLSPSIRDMYWSFGANPQRLQVIHNGANESLFRYSSVAKHADRSICLGRIDARKRQRFYQNESFIDFVGGITDQRFRTPRSNYLGEWTRQELYEKLTEYANLVLVSDYEAHALVICEALICGLGVVVSEGAMANLDLSKPFISVIPRDKLDDFDYQTSIIRANQALAVTMRDEIRAYGLSMFSWNQVVKNYVDFIDTKVISRSTSLTAQMPSTDLAPTPSTEPTPSAELIPKPLTPTSVPELTPLTELTTPTPSTEETPTPSTDLAPTPSTEQTPTPSPDLAPTPSTEQTPTPTSVPELTPISLPELTPLTEPTPSLELTTPTPSAELAPTSSLEPTFP